MRHAVHEVVSGNVSGSNEASTQTMCNMVNIGIQTENLSDDVQLVDISGKIEF